MIQYVFDSYFDIYHQDKIEITKSERAEIWNNKKNEIDILLSSLLKRLQNPSMVDIIDDMSYDEDK
jgi:hypothetical protein